MGGLVGRLFREFSVTLSVAVLISLLVSLTTTPMMCSRLIRTRDPATQGRLYRGERACVRGDAARLCALAALGAAATARC